MAPQNRSSGQASVANKPKAPRRARGSVVNPTPVGFTIEKDANVALDDLAEQFDASRSYFVQRLIEHAAQELRTTGDLNWWHTKGAA